MTCHVRLQSDVYGLSHEFRLCWVLWVLCGAGWVFSSALIQQTQQRLKNQPKYSATLLLLMAVGTFLVQVVVPLHTRQRRLPLGDPVARLGQRQVHPGLPDYSEGRRRASSSSVAERAPQPDPVPARRQLWGRTTRGAAAHQQQAVRAAPDGGPGGTGRMLGKIFGDHAHAEQFHTFAEKLFLPEVSLFLHAALGLQAEAQSLLWLLQAMATPPGRAGAGEVVRRAVALRGMVATGLVQQFLLPSSPYAVNVSEGQRKALVAACRALRPPQPERRRLGSSGGALRSSAKSGKDSSWRQRGDSSWRQRGEGKSNNDRSLSSQLPGLGDAIWTAGR
eukprot:CAMPEP_0194696598 /NCGR_PEP_ID=MMETSP0295-20121207/22803_1 /TAXON_ID=39354 /ORGANISM="Heterosigma akashiwo, Strain CCMP2393" /LENGTH=333 /DNA_ID=CAMNT_0039588863 /DNA_START=550 /DNA_END=1549 /DNA_ORIENTATION=-